MGRVTGPYGVRGWMKVAPFTEATDALAGYPTWWLARDGDTEAREYGVEAARPHADTMVAKLAGVESREAAAAFKGLWVEVPRDALPALREDEVYLGDLVGAAVVNRSGEALGTVVAIDASGAQAVLRVRAEDGVVRLVPFVPPIVEAVDLGAGRIEVDWGLDY
jgi:16S rRNA processing protein RimM